MEQLGFPLFSVAGHDRGGRVAYRLALDHPNRVERLAVLDILPTATAWERADSRFALAYWPWSLLAQPEPLPERLIQAAPEAIIDDALSAWGSPFDHIRCPGPCGICRSAERGLPGSMPSARSIGQQPPWIGSTTRPIGGPIGASSARSWRSGVLRERWATGTPTWVGPSSSGESGLRRSRIAPSMPAILSGGDPKETADALLAFLT